MAVADFLLKKFNLFINAGSFAGQIEEFSPPKLAVKTEDYQAAGMDAPMAIDVGLEKLEVSFTLTGYDPDVIKNFGLSEGQTVLLEAKGALENASGVVTPVSIVMAGKLTTYEPDAWKPGATAKIKFTVSLRYYKQEQGGKTLVEVDVANCVRVINGVDQLAAMRAAIGM